MDKRFEEGNEYGIQKATTTHQPKTFSGVKGKLKEAVQTSIKELPKQNCTLPLNLEYECKWQIEHFYRQISSEQINNPEQINPDPNSLCCYVYPFAQCVEVAMYEAGCKGGAKDFLLNLSK